MRTVLVRHTQKGLSVNITIITALCRHDLDRIQCLDVIKRHARIQVDDLIAIQGELGCRIPVESLHVRALENGTVQRDFQTFVLDITGVHYDSRQVMRGGLFVAISGFQTDGHKYIPKAAENGAACIVCEKKPEMQIPYVLVSDARAALAVLGANWFGHPADDMCVIGITGTNGKTTSTYLLKHVLEQTLGAKVGLIGTIQNMIGDEILHTERTTPESFELQKLFADMRDAGCTHVIMEVSSHALVLHRADQIRFSAAVFTNLTEDHLDFHKTMDAYCDAKAMLFRRCETGAVNVDDAYAKRIMEQADCRLLTYSAQGNPASLMAEHVELFSDRVEFDAVYQNKRASVTLGIPGIFSVYNALGVIAAALALNIPLQKIADALRTAQSVKGRVEVVPTPGKDYTVLIDYSHTPDSLENILKAVRGFCTGRVIAVFGCGGDRDPYKRPVMGKIAAELSDLAIVTSDNPRTEDPYKILRQILAGMQDTETPYEVIESRVSAIGRAMELARKNDVIVLCGKGHETYQEIGHEKHHLDEREVVASYLEAKA